MINKVSPLEGWALELVVTLDTYLPGFAGMYLRASSERRQVIAALCAVNPPKRANLNEMTEAAEFLSRADHRSILLKAFGEVPAGLRGALSRSGPQPYQRAYYLMLHTALAKPPHPHLVGTINQLGALDLMKLRIAATLPQDICRANVVDAISSYKMAEDVVRIMDLFTHNGVNREALAKSVCQVGSERELGELWKRWMQRTVFPKHPVPASECYFPISTAAESVRLARQYRNCLAERYIPAILDRNDAFAEFRVADQRAIVHLRRHGGGWRLENVLGKQNMQPKAQLRSIAVDYLRENGVAVRSERKVETGEWQVLQRLTSPSWFFEGNEW